MTLTEEQRNALLEAAKPLMQWMKDNCHPHCQVQVESDRACLVEGIATVIEKA